MKVTRLKKKKVIPPRTKIIKTKDKLKEEILFKIFKKIKNYQF